MKTKVCSRCKKEKSINKFYNHKKGKFGKDHRCIKCHKEYTKNLYKKGREWLNKYKINKGCQICGYNKCAEALVFHHKNPKEKEYTIGSLPRFSIKRIKKELSKCIVLCCRCHRELHSGLALLTS